MITVQIVAQSKHVGYRPTAKSSLQLCHRIAYLAFWLCLYAPVRVVLHVLSVLPAEELLYLQASYQNSVG